VEPVADSVGEGHRDAGEAGQPVEVVCGVRDQIDAHVQALFAELIRASR
jgi:hypothetical protein